MDRFDAFLKMLARLGTQMSEQTRLLEFGCGEGELVAAAAQHGIDAYGCDIDFSACWIDQRVLSELMAAGRVRHIDTVTQDNTEASPLATQPYRLPFDDSFFDVVVSDQVLEHVRNYPDVVAELRRVMKPGAVFLHLFPSRYRPIEAHILVPFSSTFHPDWWLRLWARLGLRNEYQRGMSIDETVAANREFLATMVNYLRRGQIERYFSASFDIRFVENEFFKVSKRAKVFLLPALYRTLQGRALYGVRRPD